MESIIGEILYIGWPSKCAHHPATIAFWRSVQKELEQGRNNRLATHMTHAEYIAVRRAAYVGSNRTPCNELQLCSAECVTDGYDV